MDAPNWKLLYSERFDYQRTLSGEDIRFYVERPDAPSKEIQRQLQEEPGRATKFFLSGSAGSGKSSELARLGRLLQDDFAVIGLDAYQSAANVTRLTGAETLFMIGAAAVRSARDYWGQDLSEDAVEGLFEAFRGVATEPSKLSLDRLLEGTSVLAGVAATAVGLPGQAIAGAGRAVATAVGSHSQSHLTIPRPFGGLTREVREGDPEVERLTEALAQVLGEVAAYRPPVVLVDGLDRVEELASIRQLFLATRLLDLPPCPVVYAGPIALAFAPEAMVVAGSGRFETAFLPNVPVELPATPLASVTERNIQGGRAVLGEIVARRLASLGLSAPDLFDDGVLDLLIIRSGGVIRDLIRLVHWSFRLAGRRTDPPARIDAELAEAAFQRVAQDVQPMAANALRLDELRQVEATGTHSGSDESTRLLLRGAILAYRDHVPWFRVHPFLRPLLGT